MKKTGSKGRLCKAAAAALCICLTAAGLVGLGLPAESVSDAQTVTAWATDTVDLSTLLNMDELTGWVTEEGGVTGGGDATPVIVTTTDEFAAAVSGSDPAVVVVSGSFDAITSGGSAISIGSNKTIVGIDSEATLRGGIDFNGQTNVIVSNLTLKGCLTESHTPDDVINVSGSDHIWFNHLDISDGGDGNLDIKGGSNYITVSWCKFSYTDSTHDHRLSCLIGSGAGDHDDTDYGKLKVTYHHNWFADLCYERMPRVMYGKAHVYNNYYSCSGNLYCIGVDCYASVLIENNYFYKVKNPHQFMEYTGATQAAYITARGNKYDGTSGDQDEGEAPDRVGSVAAFDDPPYAYVLDDAEDVPELVQTYAGPQDYDPEATPVPTATPKPSTEPTAEPTAKPLVSPSPSPTPSVNDNPFTVVEDDEMGEAIQMNGQNSDDTNGYYTFENPFAGKDFSETPTYSGGYPVWTKGVTISYWQYIPKSVSAEAAVLNFSGVHRAIHYQDWPLYVAGTEDGYKNRFEDNGGTYSLIREGNVTGGLQISSYASFGYSEDDSTAWDINPYSYSYATVQQFQWKNYLYYFANTSGTKSKLVSKKGTWHMVTIVIKNDLITTYVDGSAVSYDCFNYWGVSLTSSNSRYVNGEGFNLGYGWSLQRRTASNPEYYSHGMTILDFLSDENTTLTLGGDATLWESLSMSDYTTPSGIRIAKFTTYDEPLTADEVAALADGTEPDVTEAPTKEPAETTSPLESSAPTATPDVTQTPEPASVVLYGDADENGTVDARDALAVLRAVVRLTTLSDTQTTAADVDGDGSILTTDVLLILQKVVRLIDVFPVEK